jgi:hypothetical protein
VRITEIIINTYPIVCELHARYHEDATVAGLPVVVADKRTLAGGALAFGDACHAEADVFGLVEGSRVEDGDTVPTRLDLDRQVLLPAHR